MTALVRPGSNLARLEDLPRLVGIEPADLLDVDTLSRVLRRAAPDFVVHAAVAGGHGATPEEATNLLASAVLGTNSLLRALAGVPIRRLVHAGSCLEYAPRCRPLREDDLLGPVTLRGVAKAATTLLLQQCSLASHLPVVTLRLFHVYGPREQPHRLIATASRALVRGFPLPLTRGETRRDFVFIDDVAAAFLAALVAEFAVPAIVNIGTGVVTTNVEVVSLLREISGRPLDVVEGTFPQRAVDTEQFGADISLARALLGWTPTRSLREGLAETYRWWEANLGERNDGA